MTIEYLLLNTFKMTVTNEAFSLVTPTPIHLVR